MKTSLDLITNGILKEHNIPTYLILRQKFDAGETMVGLTQATGTGKSYIIAQFLYDECFRLKAQGKRGLIVTPTNALARQTAKILFNTVGPNLKNITATTYADLLTVTDDDSAVDFDVIVLDEFHRLGAEKWGPATLKILDANPNAKVLGLTATPIRYLDDARNMGEEIFNGSIVQGPNLAEAIARGILPKPKYILGLYSYDQILGDLASAIEKCPNKKTKSEIKKLYELAKRETLNTTGLQDLILRNISDAEKTEGKNYRNGKYIAYCSDTDHAKEVLERLPKLLTHVNSDVHTYCVNYKLTKESNNENIEAFENDNSSAIKVMVAINMFDEGLHIPNVSGVFCFSNTSSPIKHFQRIGRAIDAGNVDRTPLIFDFVNNITCLKDFNSCCGTKKQENNVGSITYSSPFSSLPFDIDAKSLALAEMLLKIDFLMSNYALSADQWIEVFDEYFKSNPNGNNITKSTQFNSTKYGNLNIGTKQNSLRQSYNNGNGKPSQSEQKIIDYLIASGHQSFLVKQNKSDITLSPEQWVEVFDEYFKIDPQGEKITRSTKFTSSKYGLLCIGTKRNSLRHDYNNGKGNPSKGDQKIIDYLISKGHLDFISKQDKSEISLAPEQWIELFDEYFKSAYKNQKISQSTEFLSEKYGLQQIGIKCSGLKQAYNNGNGQPSPNEQIIIDYLLTNGHQDLLTKQDKADNTLTPEQWIEVFDEYFKYDSCGKVIHKATKFVSSKYGEINIYNKLDHLKSAYNNGKGKPSLSDQKIISHFITTGRIEMLSKQDRSEISLTPEQWIEVFDEYFTYDPDGSKITSATVFASSKYGEQYIGLKQNTLKKMYNNGKGKPAENCQKIINFFISSGHSNLLSKQDKSNISLNSEQWIEVFKEYFQFDPNGSKMTPTTVFESEKYGKLCIGTKRSSLRQSYNNGNGKPYSGDQKIIEFLLNNGYGHILTKKQYKKRTPGSGESGDSELTI